MGLGIRVSSKFSFFLPGLSLEVEKSREKKNSRERKKKPFSPKNRKFFINWYAGELLAHGERLADAAVSVFGLAEEEEEGEDQEAQEEEMTAAAEATRREGDEAAAATKAAVAAAVSLPSPTAAVPLPALRREARSTSLASMDSDVGAGANGGGNGNGKGSTAALAAAAAAAADAAAGGGSGPLGRGPPPAWDRASLPPRPRGLSVALKVAGVHWWYRHPSHAAELTGEFLKDSFFFFSRKGRGRNFFPLSIC